MRPHNIRLILTALVALYVFIIYLLWISGGLKFETAIMPMLLTIITLIILNSNINNNNDKMVA